jgi:hypothetical protein
MTKPTKAKPPANKAKPPVAKKSQSVKKPPAKAATKEQPTKKAAADEPGLAKFLYVFGQSDGGKPRGARFPVAQFGQIQEAVGELKLATCSDTSPRLTELGMKLPLGRVYARGKAFIPFIKKELLDQLRDAQYGPMSAPAGQEIAKEDVTLPDGPMTWDEVKAGDLVIAHQNHVEGWWEANVVEREEDILTLTWVDYPDEGQVRRHIASIALRHPGPIKSPFR